MQVPHNITGPETFVGVTLQGFEDRQRVYIMRDDVIDVITAPGVMATSDDVMSDVFSSSCDAGRNSICGVGNASVLSLQLLLYCMCYG